MFHTETSKYSLVFNTELSMISAADLLSELDRLQREINNSMLIRLGELAPNEAPLDISIYFNIDMKEKKKWKRVKTTTFFENDDGKFRFNNVDGDDLILKGTQKVTINLLDAEVVVNRTYFG